MTLRELRKVNSDSKFELTILDNKGKWIDTVIVDYQLSEGSNVDYMLDLYALSAKVRFISHNSALNLTNITVKVNTKHSLYPYSIIAENVRCSK